jgi:nicotinate phosphoribosyltransferase
VSCMAQSETSVLVTDYYALTMLASYLKTGRTATAVFEFFVRSPLPPERRFLVAAGLGDAIEYLLDLETREDERAWLAGVGFHEQDLRLYLENLRFTGDVDAVPEGTVVFPDEPILRVSAPLPVAQLVEARLINILHYQTLVASKAARMMLAARSGTTLIDFGLRRAHGAEAGLMLARASYLVGFDGTATVHAGRRYGIPLYGTMAHSFVLAYPNEEDAFLAYARTHPEGVTLLIDTYDDREAVRTVARLRPLLAREGIAVRAVRVDSGDLAAQSRLVRSVLDAQGAADVRIFASGGIDEHVIAEHVRREVPIDGYGVGTLLANSSDVPALNCAYKMVAYDHAPRCKLSAGKATRPGVKQVFRTRDGEGRIRGDVVGLEDETHEGERLLVPVVRAGERLSPEEPLERIRARVRDELSALPDALRGVDVDPSVRPYPVRFTPALEALAHALASPPPSSATFPSP